MANITNYIRETLTELIYKVTWPTTQELLANTMVVTIACLLLSILIFLVDFLFGANPENSVFKGIIYYIYDTFI